MKRADFGAPRCPGTLKDGFSTYCPAVLRNVFNRKQVFHVLSEMPIGPSWEKARIMNALYDGQIGYRLRQEGNILVPDKTGEFLIKTVAPGNSTIRFQMEQPANEHICLQIASQVFELETLPNTMIFFPDGQPAIICRNISSMKAFVDFETLLQKWTDETAQGKRRKISFFDLAAVLDHFGAANIVLKDRFFQNIVANWILGNTYGYMKNAGLVRTSRNDFILAPLISMLSTRIHELSPELPLPGGLFDGDIHTDAFRENGHYSRNEFETFGMRLGLPVKRVKQTLDFYSGLSGKAGSLIERAFLPNEAKAIMLFYVREDISRLK